MAFASYLFNNPIFASCFTFYIIPFWVPVLGYMYGFDPVMMGLLLVMIAMSKSYVDSEITFKNHMGNMFRYLFTIPFFTIFKFVTVAMITIILLIYGINGDQVDRWVAAISIVFVLKVFYIKPETSGHWQVKGLRVNKMITTSCKILTTFLWLSFFIVDVTTSEKIAIAICAMIVSVFTFLKSNEGLI